MKNIMPESNPAFSEPRDFSLIANIAAMQRPSAWFWALTCAAVPGAGMVARAKTASTLTQTFDFIIFSPEVVLVWRIRRPAVLIVAMNHLVVIFLHRCSLLGVY
ncbi:MAG: hypothetical protein EON59_02580 [Alphaproteobacteria bacterium]|nr:MAG: hypothetical protein EON59_02580 [Alphaproteobacteria bacterium]